MTFSLKLILLTAILALFSNTVIATGFNSLDSDLSQCAYAGESDAEEKKKKKAEEEEEEEPECE